MGWDDTAPTSQELESLSWDSTPPTDSEMNLSQGPELIKDISSIQNPQGQASGLMADYWEKNGDMPSPGEENPIEQKLAENIQTAGAGMGIGKGVGDIAEVVSKMAKSPLIDTAKQYAERLAQNQQIKAFGGSSGQLRQMGVPESRELAQWSLDKNLQHPFQGPIGLEERVNNLEKMFGSQVGDARKAGDIANPTGAPALTELLPKVDQALAEKYGSGVEKSPAAISRAKEEMAKGPMGTFTQNAQKATDLNASAKNEMSLMRPSGPASMAAKIISSENNSALQKILSPQQFSDYQEALKDYGNIKKIQKLFERGEVREMGGRGGGSLTKELKDKTMDSFGNRTIAWGANKVAKALASPAIARVLPALTKAAAQGGKQLAITHLLLFQNDPSYREALSD